MAPYWVPIGSLLAHYCLPSVLLPDSDPDCWACTESIESWDYTVKTVVVPLLDKQKSNNKGSTAIPSYT